MIKGVNKRIIEVKETDSRVFESALLFVSPAYCGCDDVRLKREADRVLSNFSGSINAHICDAKPKKEISKKRYPISFALGTVLGFLIAFFIFK